MSCLLIQDYGKYRCETDDIEACLASPTPIPNFAFMDATEAMNATKDVYLILPTIFRIITCNFVKITFEDILMHHCGPLKGVLTVLWVSLLIASVAMMPLLGLWAMHGRTFSNNRVKYLLRKKAREFGFWSSMLSGQTSFLSYFNICIADFWSWCSPEIQHSFKKQADRQPTPDSMLNLKPVTLASSLKSASRVAINCQD